MTDKELIYTKVGKILHISQAIEYNLHFIIIYDNILKSCFSKEEVIKKLQTKNEYYESLAKQSTGNSIDLARKTKIFTEEFVISLSKTINSRNYYAHRFFKENFINKTDIDYNYFNEKLDKDIKRLNDMNTELGNDLNELILLIKKKIS
jgi:hypothetical protein